MTCAHLTSIPTNPANLRRIVTDPDESRPVQRLAWAALKSARGQPIFQTRLAALALGRDPAAPAKAYTLEATDASDLPAALIELLRKAVAENATRRPPGIAPGTGGDAA
ncbi:hypothetical protein [Roseicyclus marinus]|uniref:hypothetical protein n=1 Tax=Roseicyclus marinus TaxID=2161673 RepID=UPI00240F8C6D|nr:hypothetical protein [Roseicyclus marinus]MDG3040462.1 hypothetical protein [Roseicyclus marinus]